MATIQSRITPSPVDILCLGDSQTLIYTSGIDASKFWASELQIQGVAANYSLETINCGNSGWTTTQLLAIATERIQRTRPTILVFYAGVNDAGASVSSATTQANIQAVLDIAFANGVSHALVMNTNYLNYSSGGDNAGASTYYSAYVTLRTYQAAAVTAWQAANPTLASKVALCDLFTYQKNLVLAATTGWVQGTFGSLIADSNQHMNAVGHKASATKVLTDLVSLGALNACKVLTR
jgi:lysophospholipase L1-like esterase